MVLAQDVFKPEGEMFFRVKAGDMAGGRMEDHIDGFAFGLTLHGGDGHVQIKMLGFQVAQLMLQNLGLPFRREKRIEVDIKSAVVIGYADALHLAGQSDMADIIINHMGKGEVLSLFDGVPQLFLLPDVHPRGLHPWQA